MNRTEAIDFIARESKRWPRRYVRHLFGSAGFFCGPRLFLFVMETSFCLKVSEKNRQKLMRDGTGKQFFNAGRPFGKWLEVQFPVRGKKLAGYLPYMRDAYLAARKSLARK